MSRQWAYILLGIVVAIFLVGVLDVSLANPSKLISLSAVILAGVGIGSILAGLRRNGAPEPEEDHVGRGGARIGELEDHDE